MKIVSLCFYCVYIILQNLSIIRVNGEVRTACTSSVITTTYTPCFNFITGSSRSNRSSSPTRNCCYSMKSFVSNNLDCACLIVTGNVPIPFINQNLAISLPRICNGGLPIQCKATGAPLPAPGPALFAPPPPTIVPPVEAPSNSTSPAPEPKPRRASKTMTLAPTPPPDEKVSGSSPTSSPSEPSPPTTHPKMKPVLNPKSSSTPSRYMLSPSVMIIIAIIVLEYWY